MAKAITTSIRLEPDLREKLEKAAHNLHRGKNWLISEALRRYLEQLESSGLAQEARRQSLLASKFHHTDWELWEADAEHEDWTPQ
jgi:predicted DNA-binding protein